MLLNATSRTVYVLGLWNITTGCCEAAEVPFWKLITAGILVPATVKVHSQLPGPFVLLSVNVNASVVKAVALSTVKFALGLSASGSSNTCLQYTSCPIQL